MRWREVMKREVATVSAKATLHSAALKMATRHTDLLAVVEQDELVGMISTFDIVAKGLVQDLDLQHTPVDRIMTPHVEMLCQDANLQDAIQHRHAAGVGHLLIKQVHGEKAGIVTWHDVLGITTNAQLTGKLLQQDAWPPQP